MSSTFSQSSSAVDDIKRHPRYYLNGGDLHFLVENFIFCVHRYFFERESQWFREQLGATTPINQPSPGSSEAHPFPLSKVTAEDFVRFLWIFYNPRYSIYDADIEDWVAILNLASEWRFAQIKNLCTRELEKFDIDPIVKIELYQRYELDGRLLIPSFQQLCMRRGPLSLQEGRRVGLETSIFIANARECARGELASDGIRSPIEADIGEENMLSIVKDIFGLNTGPPSPSLDRGSGAGTSTSTSHNTSTPESLSSTTQGPVDGASNGTTNGVSGHQANQNGSANGGTSAASNGNISGRGRGSGGRRRG